MLLKLLYDFAVSRGLPDALAFKPGTPVRWIVNLDPDGNLVGAGPVETEGGDRNKGKEYDVPKTSRPTGGGQVADFLVDDIGAIFELKAKLQEGPNERATSNLKAKHEDFWRQITEAHAKTGRPEFKTILRFREQLAGNAPSFLRKDLAGPPKWMVKRAGGDEIRLGNDLFTFAVGNNVLILDEGIRDYWRQVHAQEMQRTEEAADNGVCLVTGRTDVPIARTHTPMVTGLPSPARGTGAGIVGFESDSFRSYGFEKSANASTSIAASKAYLLALQHLSSRDDHWLSLGPAWLCFWAAETEPASALFAQLLRKPDSLTIRNLMTSPWAGVERPPSNLEKFYAITMTAAGPRLVIKDWVQVTVGEAVDNFRAWFNDLQMDSIKFDGRTESRDEGRAPLSVFRLACTTLRPDANGKFDAQKLKPDLLASLYQAALRRTAPPIGILKSVLDRFQAKMAKDGSKALYDESRFALLKLILNRNRRGNDMEIRPKLIADTDDPAYNCGRLLSVFNSLQRSAHDGKLEGATIAERYFGSASASPSAAFSILWRLHQHHLKKLRQKGEKGQKAAHRIKETITQICSRFAPQNPGESPELPRVLTLTKQGRFALGFYQQEAARAEAVRLWKQKQEAMGQQAPDEDIPEEDLFTDNPE
ncbi:MAG: type I-C CRISPR-associated protein Cas8c/Csd1 [Candidatus Korobacteraceae bacterium]